MLYREYKKLFFEYCDSEITKELYRTRKRDNYINGKWRSLCTLDQRAEEDSTENVVDLLVGEVDINIEPLLPLIENVTDERIVRLFKKLLSEKEQKVVSLRLKYKVPMKIINELINTTRKQTSTRIFNTAIEKLKNEVDKTKGE
ncbi:MAG: hypothetical protein IJ220_08800 [Clostridia bacterium]|nr:hypothetical protein [Clostridia bacterium]